MLCGDLVFALQLFISFSPIFVCFLCNLRRLRFESPDQNRANRIMMDWNYLELKVISCKDLKAFNFFQKLSVYAIVSVVNIEQSKKKTEEQQVLPQRQKTSIDKGGNKNPEWNHVFQFDLKSLPSDQDIGNLFVKFDFRHEGLVHRSIGEVHVPLKELVDEFRAVVRFVSYQVRNSDGKPNGVLNFSYKLIGKQNDSPAVPQVINRLPSGKVTYPKLELEDDAQIQTWDNKIHYPSLDDLYDPPRQQISFASPGFECSKPGYFYNMNSAAILFPMQVPFQGFLPGRYLLHPYSSHHQ